MKNSERVDEVVGDGVVYGDGGGDDSEEKRLPFGLEVGDGDHVDGACRLDPVFDPVSTFLTLSAM